MLKLIENNHYHIWTDALHARALSHEASNRWDRGTYVRWTVMTAWVALEIACQDALEEPRISYSFKDNPSKAIKRNLFQNLIGVKGYGNRCCKCSNIGKTVYIASRRKQIYFLMRAWPTVLLR